MKTASALAWTALLWFPLQISASAQPAKIAAEAGPLVKVMSTVSSDGIRLTQMIGAMVTDANRLPLGIVNDVLFDRFGKTTAVVVAIAPSRGLGDKNIAVKPDLLMLQDDSPADARGLYPDDFAQPGTRSLAASLRQADLVAAPDFASSPPTSAGTMESAPSDPKSSTESGGPG